MNPVDIGLLLGGHPLTILVLLPAVAALLVIALPGRLALRVALTASCLAGVLALALGLGFDPSGQALREVVRWVPRYGISWDLALDGLGLPLVGLTVLVTPLALLLLAGSEHRSPALCACFLFLESGLLGLFTAQDLLLFYLFWEAVLIPLYLIVGLWGGEGRIRAALVFVLYTLAGSLLMLVGMLVLVTRHLAAKGYGSFSLESLAALRLPPDTQVALFVLFAAAFAVKVPLFPFHAWQPDAYAEAPPAGAVMLAALVSKMGLYGFLKVGLPLFPHAVTRLGPWLVALALVGALWGAFLALAEDDLRRFLAYASLSHLGLACAGIFTATPAGLTGAGVQMVSHGLITAGLFLLVEMVRRRRRTVLISELGGLRHLPVLAGALLFFSLAALGLPGLSSFTAEFFVLSGIFAYSIPAGLVGLAVAALGALYLLRMAGRLVYGTGTDKPAGERDLEAAEWIGLVPPAVGVVLLGLFPGALIRALQVGMAVVIRHLGGS